MAALPARPERSRAVCYTCGMPTRVSAAIDLERELLTAEDFLDWLEPGGAAPTCSMERYSCTHRFPFVTLNC